MSDNPFAECDICNKKFTGPEPYMEHLNSKTHINTMLEIRKKNKYLPLLLDESATVGKLKCNVCNIIVTSEKTMKQHENGSTHLKNLKKENIMSNIQSENDGTDISGALKCDYCEKGFTGPVNLKQHLESKKHARKMELATMKSQLNGTVRPSCPSVSEKSFNLQESSNIQPTYPQFGYDYNIVHEEIENSRKTPLEAKKKEGCFPFIKKKIYTKKIKN